MLGSFSAAMKKFTENEMAKNGRGFSQMGGRIWSSCPTGEKGSERRVHLAGLFQIGKLGSSKIAM
jgi:hypothetical protein